MNDPTALVESFGLGDGGVRYASYEALVAMSERARPAVRAGLGSPSWQVRRWCAICLDRIGDENALADLVPLLSDPHPKVRLWAVHSIACDHCKDEVTCPVDVVPLLIRCALEDSDLRVRRMAVIMLGSEIVDARALGVLEELSSSAEDRKLREHAGRGAAFLRRALREEPDGPPGVEGRESANRDGGES